MLSIIIYLVIDDPIQDVDRVGDTRIHIQADIGIWSGIGPGRAAAHQEQCCNAGSHGCEFPRYRTASFGLIFHWNDLPDLMSSVSDLHQRAVFGEDDGLVLLDFYDNTFHQSVSFL